jgi:hypothetical protein
MRRNPVDSKTISAHRTHRFERNVALTLFSYLVASDLP